jgi:hypothetical protein
MNKRKYSNVKRHLSVSSVLLAVFIIFGCAPKTTPPSIIPPPPAKIESVAPSLRKVSDGIDRTIETNTKIDTTIKQQRETVLRQKIKISETITKVEKLREKVLAEQLIKEIEVVEIINDLRTIEQRNLFLETQNGELENIRKDQAAILKMTKEDASITYRKLMDKENEANELRNQNTFLATNLTTKNQEAETLKKNLEKEKVKAAKASVYRNWIFGLVGGFVLWIIIKNVLMVYFPMTKFRI